MPVDQGDLTVGWEQNDVPESGDETSENDQETVSETCHLGPNFGTKMVIKHFNSKRNVSLQLDGDDGPDSDGGDGGQQDRGQNDDLTPEAQGALALQAAIEEDIDAQCELSAVSGGSVPAMTEDQVKCKQKILKNKKAAIF